MTKKLIASTLVGLSLAHPAMAQDRKTVGWSMVAGGTGAFVAAFNYSKHCPAGSRSVRVPNPDPNGTTTITYCIEGERNINIYTEPTSATFARPALAWVGLSAIGTGLFLALLPKKAGVTASLTPQSVQIMKTINF